jgi:nitrate reductase NapE component
LKTCATIKEVDWEVLPPEERRRRQGVQPLFKWLALIMDEIVRIPGTKFRFGLDPLLGLIPGIGDTSSALVSAFALIQAARIGVPKILLARMSLNILINEIIGVVPVIGDAFSFWFKSNARNYQIIKDHAVTPSVAKRSDWIFVIAVLVVLVAIVCLGLVLSFLFLQALANFLSGR